MLTNAGRDIAWDIATNHFQNFAPRGLGGIEIAPAVPQGRSLHSSWFYENQELAKQTCRQIKAAIEAAGTPAFGEPLWPAQRIASSICPVCRATLET